MRRRFLTGLTRQQFTWISTAGWFVLGNVAASSLPWWLGLAIAAGIGTATVLLNHLAVWLLHRRDGRTA